MADMDINFLWFAFLGYVIGSIPFGLLLTKAAGMGDVRAIGSGNIGATNVLRTGSKPIAFATLLADILKGTAPVLLALRFGDMNYAMAAGFGAFIGHNFPVWLKFKGGKGVATYLGVLLGLYWPLMIVFGVCWLTVAFTKKISSLSALVACVIVALAGFAFSGVKLGLFLTFLAALIYFSHRENIARLLNGTESKIKLSSDSKTS